MTAGPEQPLRPLLHITGLAKTFGTSPVLQDIDLSVAAGEKLALIGASGSGKTTLLRCIAQLERPSRGEIRIAGRCFGDRTVEGRRIPMPDRDLAAMRAEIGMVFQRFNLFPHLTVLDNVMLGPLKVLRQRRADVQLLALDLLRKVGLPDKAAQYPEQLSGGQQQRVAIARSLAMKPKLMLFDEATSALDPELIGEVLAVMRRLAEEGMTMLIVTHEMRFAQDVADRIVVMDQGRIIDQGSPAELLRSPGHPRTTALLRAEWDREQARVA